MHRSQVPDGLGALDRGGHQVVPLLPLGTAVLRQRRLIIAAALAFAVAAVALALLIVPGGFSATSRFMPEEREQAQTGGVGGIVAQLGLGSFSQRSPLAFYSELLASREILRQAVGTNYQFEVEAEGRRDTLSGTLVELYESPGSTSVERTRAAVGRLRDAITVEGDPESGLVAVETTMPWPKLAERVNERLLELLNEFNVEQRQSRARAESEFVSARLEAERAQLREAEEAVRRFMERNRQVESPELRLELVRFEREVSLHQQVYMALATAYEDARIRAVRNTPVITVLERPAGSARRAGPPLMILAVLAAMTGAMFGTGLALLRAYLAQYRRTYPDEYRDFDAARRAAFADLSPRRLAGLVRRFVRS